MVERAVTPFLRPGPSRAVGFTTVSQGRPGRFDLEAINGVWRGGAVDNEAACFRGEAPVAGVAPQWTRSTLPMSAIGAAARGRYPVVRNPEIAYATGANPPTTTACDLPPLPSTTTSAAASSSPGSSALSVMRAAPATSAAKKTTATKTAAKKTPAKKATAKKSTGKKAPAKKAAPVKRGRK